VEASISRASNNSTVIVIQNRHDAELFLKGELKSSTYALANQTTMLYSETCEIENYLRAELGKKNLKLNACQTICKATYMRQTAAEKLLSDNSIDLVFVVGGYDSSNTNNLYKLALSKHQRTFYIKDALSLKQDLTLEHYIPSEKKVSITELKQSFPTIRRIAILAGASCPVSLVEEIIQKLKELNEK
jgi:4-hydroxy-3-methylbut-2-enyl diphosphate reductase